MKDNYEIVYAELLKKLEKIDLGKVAVRLGARHHQDRLELKFLGTPYLITHQGVRRIDGKEPNISIRIVLCHYLLQAGQGKLTGQWVSYRDFKDSAFFISNFQANVEARIAHYFAGRTDQLEKAAQHLDGAPYQGFQTGDLCYHFRALPHVPVLLVFYDRDSEFPASCKVLFDRSAPIWLDMECLAVLGWIIADHLIKISRRPTPVE